MTFRIARHRHRVRLGADACPGISERGHGLTMRTIHDSTCCAEWDNGQASAPSRAEAFNAAAARWGLTWPPQPQPGHEPEAGR
jgi:hypothetical protein